VRTHERLSVIVTAVRLQSKRVAEHKGKQKNLKLVRKQVDLRTCLQGYAVTSLRTR
jgi:hypothetical protein